MTAEVRINGPLAEVQFNQFDLDSYALFLQCKALPEHQISYAWETDTYTLTTPARFAPRLGVQSDTPPIKPLDLAPHLFDYQRWIVQMAIDAKRYAVWADTGLGKGPMLLEWCRQVGHLTGARVLILEPLAVIPQLIGEARRFYGDDLPIERIETREALATWCQNPAPALGIVNPEKFIPGVLPELRHLGGLAFDESSLLKSGGGVIKWNLIKSARGIEYKLSCTATPAPNEVMEYASQASFLEKLRTEGEILWTYFTRDKQGNWRVKPHARQAFYQFMASWSIYLRDPKRFGFADILATLPPADIQEYRLDITDIQRELMYTFIAKKGGGLFSDDRLGVTERTKLSQIAKGFLYDSTGKARTVVRIPSVKPAFVADLVRTDVADGRQVLVWTIFDEETEILIRELEGLGIAIAGLSGAMTESARAATLEAFRTGAVQVLVSKASLIGYGMNLQHCRSMVFSGFDDSFERMYQAVRRCVRFGQTETVRVHIPYVPELEGMVYTNVKRKEAAFMVDVDLCEAQYRDALVREGAVA